MPAIWAALTMVFGNLVKDKIGYWITTALVSLGISIAVSKFVVDPALNDVKSAIGGAGSVAVAWLGYLKVDKCITAILSAYAVAAGTSGIRLRKRGA